MRSPKFRQLLKIQCSVYRAFPCIHFSALYKKIQTSICLQFLCSKERNSKILIYLLYGLRYDGFAVYYLLSREQ